MPTTSKEFTDLLTHMFVQAPTFMALLRGPEHRFELANPSYLKLVGHRPVIGRTVAEALPDAVDQGFMAVLDNTYRTGTPYTATGARFAMQSTPSAPVDERFLDFVYQPLRDSADNVVGIFVQGSDVTDRTIAERKMRDSEELYKGLFDAIDEGFCIIEFLDTAHGTRTATTFIFEPTTRTRGTLVFLMWSDSDCVTWWAMKPTPG